jgi:rod shape-determining protein MreD
MPRLILAVIVAGAILAQASLLPRLTMLAVRPNLVLVLVLLWTIARGGREGAMLAFGAGLLLDVVTLSGLGTHALALLAVVPLGVACRTSSFSLGLLLPMLAAVAATLLHDAVLLLLQGTPVTVVTQSLVRLSLLGGILNLAMLPLLSIITSWLSRWVALQEETAGRPRAMRALSRRR